MTKSKASLLLLTLFTTIIHSTRAFVPIPCNKTAIPPTWSLTYDYTGQSFFNNFQFFTAADPTNGHVKYIDLPTANTSSLVGLLPPATTSSPHPQIFLGVDATVPSPNGRASVRLSSIQKLNPPFLLLADIQHMPAPICGTWPALWLLGSPETAPRPAAGEIDILENVNDETLNHYTLHTSPGFITANYTGAGQKGSLATGNCDINAAGQAKNVGCSVTDSTDSKAYGDKFNDVGGGVFATLVDSLGVRIWFFPRDAIPLDIASGSPVPPPRDVLRTDDSTGSTSVDMSSLWGVPNARFESAGNGPDGVKKHFRDLQVVINTAFCGDWAGQAWKESATCSKLAASCEEYVSGNAEAFLEAFWTINSVRVFELGVMGGQTVPYPDGPLGTESGKRRRDEI